MTGKTLEDKDIEILKQVYILIGFILNKSANQNLKLTKDEHNYILLNSEKFNTILEALGVTFVNDDEWPLYRDEQWKSLM